MGKLADLMADLEEDAVLKLTKELLTQGQPPLSIVEQCRDGLSRVGERFARKEYFLAELVMAAEIFREVMAIVQPHLGANEDKGALAAIVLGTIGPLLERHVTHLYSEGNILAATLVDSAGSLAIENVANGLNYHLCQWASKRGLNIGPRLSPGYGKWNILEQRTLFHILPVHKIGVHLNEQCMMTPTKSISFCVGIGSSVKQASAKPCQHCSMDNCRYRVADHH